MIYKTQEEIDAALAYWQKALRLQDWRVKVEITRHLDDLDGTVNIELTLKSASIKIIDPVDYPDMAFWKQDMEVALVHELIHLHTNPLRYAAFERGEPITELFNIAEEQVIQAWAVSIVEMKRRTDGIPQAH